MSDESDNGPSASNNTPSALDKAIAEIREAAEERRAEAEAHDETCTNCGQSFAASRRFRLTGEMP